MFVFYRNLVSGNPLTGTQAVWEWVVESRDLDSGSVAWPSSQPSTTSRPTVAAAPDGDVFVAWDRGGEPTEPDRGVLARFDGRPASRSGQSVGVTPVQAESVLVVDGHLSIRSDV